MEFWICLLAQATTQPNPNRALFDMFIMIGAMILVFWLFVWRPQMRKDKERQDTLGTLKKNDRVVTNGGIKGIVRFVDDKEVILRVDEDNKVDIHFLKSAIVNVERQKDEGSGETK